MKKKKKKKKKKQTRLSVLEQLTASVAQDYAHQHTVTINSRRRVLEFEGSETDRAIVALSASLANQKRRRREIVAALTGLAVVVGKR